jgi:putative transposase
VELVGREEAAFLQEQFVLSERRACELLAMARSSCRYQRRPDRNEVLRERLKELAAEHPRWGYRRLQVLVVEREGMAVNHKRLLRVYREAGLCVRRKRRKRLVRAPRAAEALTGPNQQWAIDFAQDRLAYGRAFRVFSVIDAFTRECLALDVDTSFSGPRVTRVLGQVMAQRTAPVSLRLDNGPEFTSRHFLAWGVEKRIALDYIEPGKPVQNAKVESFHGRLREECLNASWFVNLWDARGKISAWRQEYNQVRPHSSLGYRTPEEFAREVAANGCGKAAAWKPLGTGVPTPLGNPAKTAGFPLSHSLGGDPIATDREKDAAEVVS